MVVISRIADFFAAPFRTLNEPVARLNAATAEMNALGDYFEKENRRLLREIEEDENRVRDYKVTIIGTDGAEHMIPLRCSRKQARKLKLAVFAAGGDALAVDR